MWHKYSNQLGLRVLNARQRSTDQNLHREINQWLLLISSYINKNSDVSVGKSKEENEAKSNENNAYCFC